MPYKPSTSPSTEQSDDKNAVAIDTNIDVDVEAGASAPRRQPWRESRGNINTTGEPLTEESLHQLELSHPRYWEAQRNINRWFHYIQSTIQDAFDTHAGIPDRDYIPADSLYLSTLSEVPLSQADFQDSHSPASSRDYFNWSVRPLSQLQVVIPVSTTTPAPSAQPTTPAPSARPATPAPSARPATPAPSARPATPAPSARPTSPAQHLQILYTVENSETETSDHSSLQKRPRSSSSEAPRSFPVRKKPRSPSILLKEH